MQEECYDPLFVADADEDDFISQIEYIELVKFYSDDPIFNVSTFQELPDKLVLEYNSLICNYICVIQNGTCGNPCEIGIPVAGVENANANANANANGNGNANANAPSVLNRLYWYEVCDETMSAIRTILNIEDPTLPPVVVDDTFEVEVPFGVANMKGLKAVDIANNTEFSLDLILDVFDQLRADVQANLWTETLGGVRMLDVVFSLESFIREIDDRSEYMQLFSGEATLASYCFAFYSFLFLLLFCSMSIVHFKQQSQR